MKSSYSRHEYSLYLFMSFSIHQDIYWILLLLDLWNIFIQYTRVEDNFNEGRYQTISHTFFLSFFHDFDLWSMGSLLRRSLNYQLLIILILHPEVIYILMVDVIYLLYLIKPSWIYDLFNIFQSEIRDLSYSGTFTTRFLFWEISIWH